MKKILIIIAIVVGVLLVLTLGIASWVKGTYNSIVTMDEGINGAWAQVENVLQRRYDLIPNLVATVKGYASHEEEVFTRVTEARARVGGAGSPAERMEAEGGLSSALSRLLLVVENYPQLKANQNFIMLQDELAGTENRISVERGRYNGAVESYNKFIRRFPQTTIAGIFNFEKREFFKAPEAAQEAPKVSFQ